MCLTSASSARRSALETESESDGGDNTWWTKLELYLAVVSNISRVKGVSSLLLRQPLLDLPFSICTMLVTGVVGPQSDDQALSPCYPPCGVRLAVLSIMQLLVPEMYSIAILPDSDTSTVQDVLHLCKQTTVAALRVISMEDDLDVMIQVCNMFIKWIIFML